MNKIKLFKTALPIISFFICTNSFGADTTSSTKPHPAAMTADQKKADIKKRMDTWKKCSDKYHPQFSQSIEPLAKQMRDLGVQEAAIMKKFREANPQLKAFTDSLRKVEQKNSGHSKDSLMFAQRRKMIQDNPDIAKALQAQRDKMRSDPDLKKIMEQRRVLSKQIREARLSVVKGDAECEECFKK